MHIIITFTVVVSCDGGKTKSTPSPTDLDWTVRLDWSLTIVFSVDYTIAVTWHRILDYIVHTAKYKVSIVHNTIISDKVVTLWWILLAPCPECAVCVKLQELLQVVTMEELPATPAGLSSGGFLTGRDLPGASTRQSVLSPRRKQRNSVGAAGFRNVSGKDFWRRSLPTHRFVCLSVCLSACPFVHLSVPVSFWRGFVDNTNV